MYVKPANWLGDANNEDFFFQYFFFLETCTDTRKFTLICITFKPSEKSASLLTRIGSQRVMQIYHGHYKNQILYLFFTKTQRFNCFKIVYSRKDSISQSDGKTQRLAIFDQLNVFFPHFHPENKIASLVSS